MRASIHVVPDDNGWAVKRDGSYASLSTHAREADAIAAARELSEPRGNTVIVHGPDGEIRETFSGAVSEKGAHASWRMNWTRSTHT